MSRQRFGSEILIEPQAKSRFVVGITPKANPLATGRVIVIGESEGGAPGIVHWFTDKIGAKDVLRSGDALRAIGMIFNPSPQHDGALYCGFVRAQGIVNTTLGTTQSEHDATSGKIVSKGYGTWVNGISVKIETPGTTASSSKISVAYPFPNDDLEVFDNLDLALTIQYKGGEDSGLIEITAGDHIIGKAGGTGTEVVVFDYHFAEENYNTVSKVAEIINSMADWECSILALAPAGIGTLNSTILNTLAECDADAVQNLKAYPHISKFALDNYSALVDGTVVTDGTQLTATTGFEFLTGGTKVAMNTLSIATALALIVEANCQIIWIDSETPADQALVTAHCLANEHYREGYFGQASVSTAAASVTAAQAAAKLMNNPRGILVGCGIDDFAEDGSGVEAIAPKFFAAKCAGLAAGLPVQEPLTRKVFNAQGLQFNFTKAQRETLIEAGVIAPRDLEGVGLVINQGVCTMQNNTGLWDPASNASPEISLNRSAGQFNKELVVAADRIFIGGTVGVGRATIVGFVESHCKVKEAEGVLAQDDSDPDNPLPAWENVIATRLADGWNVKVSIRLNNPFNFFLIETTAVL